MRHTQHGTVRISSPEATALELVGYADRCGAGVDAKLSKLTQLLHEHGFFDLTGQAPAAQGRPPLRARGQITRGSAR